jgi:hypothetical protein
MRWLEWIHMRTSPETRRTQTAELAPALLAPHPEPGLREAVLLHHAEYAGDLAILLVWDTPNPPAASRAGNALADQLACHGAVEHSLWQVVPAPPPPPPRSSPKETSP